MPRAAPVSFTETADSSVVVEVQQSVRDLEGKPLQDQAHGLKDKTVMHVFRLQGARSPASTFRTLPEPPTDSIRRRARRYRRSQSGNANTKSVEPRLGTGISGVS